MNNSNLLKIMLANDFTNLNMESEIIVEIIDEMNSYLGPLLDVDFHFFYINNLAHLHWLFNIKFISYVSNGTNGCSTDFRCMRKYISSFTEIVDPK